MPIVMIRNDIAKVSADAIVNPSNDKLLEGSGASRAIYLAAGEKKLTEACKKIGHCDVGKAVITPAFHLHAKYIIHAVGPIWVDGKHGEGEILYRTYDYALQLAKEYNLHSIAFPLLSSGNYGYPKEQALKIAIQAMSDFLMKHDMNVYLVIYDQSSVVISKKLFASIEEYIDDNYVEENDEEFSEADNDSEYTTDRSRNAMRQTVSSARSEFHPVYGDDTPKAIPTIRSLQRLIERQHETFSQMLLRLIDERGLKDSYVYKMANVDRRHFSKIRNDIEYTPNKKTVLAFAIALKLSEDETKDLLMRAGFAFSCCSKFDVIIGYFIENQKYDIFEINEVLFAYGQPTLGG